METFFTDNDIEYDAQDTIIRRELTAAGKSRAFINDTPVPLSTLKELGEQLVDVHSQHQNLLLQKQDFQLSVVDIIADDAREQEAYRQSFNDYHEAQRQLQELKDSIIQNRQQADFLGFQYNELCDARLADGEQEELEQRSETMTHAEDIKSALYEADNTLQAEQTGVVTSLHNAATALKGISRVFPAATELAERIDTAYIELKDIAQEVSSHLEDVDFDPAELDAVNARLDRIYDLQKKYHADSVTELITLRDDIGKKLSAIENSDEALQEMETRCQQLKASCQQQADILTRQRTKAARQIEKEMQQRLVPLGMPNVRFAINIEQTELI